MLQRSLRPKLDLPSTADVFLNCLLHSTCGTLVSQIRRVAAWGGVVQAVGDHANCYTCACAPVNQGIDIGIAKSTCFVCSLMTTQVESSGRTISKAWASQHVSCREAHLAAVVDETSIYIADHIKIEAGRSPSVRYYGGRENNVSYLSATSIAIYERNLPTKYWALTRYATHVSLS